MKNASIKFVRAYVFEGGTAGGDYFARPETNWESDTQLASPMARYTSFRSGFRSWGAGALGGVLVEVELADGTIGFAAGTGGHATCFLIEQHFKLFLINSDVRDNARLWDQMYRSSLEYGRQGLALHALSVVDLAIWDAMGKLHDEPVYRLIGGAAVDGLIAYNSGPSAGFARESGFAGAKVFPPHVPAEGRKGLEANVAFIAACRDQVGKDFPLMVDFYMSLDVHYAIELAFELRSLGLYWIEDPLLPDNYDGYRALVAAAPWVRWAAGEHEYTCAGFQRLISAGIAVLQPDPFYMGGLTEMLRIAGLAKASDVPIVTHCGGSFSYHFAMAQPGTEFVEYLNTSPNGDSILPVFGKLFSGEPLPQDGIITLSEKPGWGLTVNKDEVALLRPFAKD